MADDHAGGVADLHQPVVDAHHPGDLAESHVGVQNDHLAEAFGTDQRLDKASRSARNVIGMLGALLRIRSCTVA